MTVLADPATCKVPCTHPDAVAAARAALPGAATALAAAALLKVVADPTRVRMLSALHTGDLCVCDLALVAGISESATSHQLRLLRDHRVVASRKVGRTVYYRLLDAHVTTLIESAIEHAQEEGGPVQ